MYGQFDLPILGYVAAFHQFTVLIVDILLISS